jgi:hypothetical protein
MCAQPTSQSVHLAGNRRQSGQSDRASSLDPPLHTRVVIRMNQPPQAGL